MTTGQNVKSLKLPLIQMSKDTRQSYSYSLSSFSWSEETFLLLSRIFFILLHVILAES